MLSSHLLHEVEQICNRVAIIDEGRLLYQGTVEDLIEKDDCFQIKVDRVADAYDLLSQNPGLSLNRNGEQSILVKMTEEEVPLVNALLVQNGFRVMELSRRRESLEEVFLRLTQEARTESKQETR
jgi:ABC-2 type transport system ATP-binding protein